MPTDNFQAILKGEEKHTSKNHQGMGKGVLAIMQNGVPEDALWAFSGQVKRRALQGWLMGTDRQSFKATSRRPQHRGLRNHWCVKPWLLEKWDKSSVWLSDPHLHCALGQLWLRAVWAATLCNILPQPLSPITELLLLQGPAQESLPSQSGPNTVLWGLFLSSLCDY